MTREETDPGRDLPPLDTDFIEEIALFNEADVEDLEEMSDEARKEHEDG